MRSKEKKQIITEFLQRLSEKDIHLVELGKFEKELSLWSKKSPQASHRTMINVNISLDRLNENDVDLEIDKFLM
jgi:hypothetical protein|tara:strand:+ start:679 stop:900 length:222 start_codon:yes stop_codon:yes gene_type:complete